MSEDLGGEMPLQFPIGTVDSVAGRQLLDRIEARNRGGADPQVITEAEAWVDQIREQGDAALLEAVKRLDGFEATSIAELALTPRGDEVEHLPPGFAAALEAAIGAVTRFHEGQVQPGYRTATEGVELEERRRPFGRVGIYVPGGRASYPSTVVMTVVPACLAGVRDLVVATPPASYQRNAALRYTLTRLGIDQVWGMGGAHAIAALAYGTETLHRVDKIVGPGNAWVTAAKRQVLGDVAIDSLAGPTEVVILAEGGEQPDASSRATEANSTIENGARADVDPAWIAADLLAQAEHDPAASALLMTTSMELAKAVRRELAEQLEAPDLQPTRENARQSLARFGGALLVKTLEEARGLIERLAPEHLQLIGAGPEALVETIDHAGAIFLGATTPEVFGDYVAGPSHVLPTAGTARFASALGVEDFVRRSHVVRFNAAAAARWAEVAALLADAEGLPAHAGAARYRISVVGGGRRAVDVRRSGGEV